MTTKSRTYNQRTASLRNVEKRRCPACERLGALSSWWYDEADRRHRQCRYCGYRTGPPVVGLGPRWIEEQAAALADSEAGT